MLFELEVRPLRRAKSFLGESKFLQPPVAIFNAALRREKPASCLCAGLKLLDCAAASAAQVSPIPTRCLQTVRTGKAERGREEWRDIPFQGSLLFPPG